MKMTKKIVALLLFVVLLLSLPACKEEPKNTHSDWVPIPSSAALGTALSESGCYYNLNGLLHYADLATGTSVILCQKPGCKHEHGLEGNDRCDADIRSSWMVFGNDTLYYVDQNILYSRNATGGEMRELGVLAKKLVEEGISVDVFPLAVSNGYLYYEGTILESKQSASGTSSTSAGSCIGRYNLAQRKDEILFVSGQERSTESGELIAARENGILYLYHEGLDPELNWKDMKGKEYTEALYKTTVQIRHLDLTTGETTVLYTTTYGECKTVHTVENGKIFYGGGGNGTSSYDLNTEKAESFYKGEFSSSYYGKGYWQRKKLLDAQTAEYHIYDMNTGKTLPYELKGNYAVTNQSVNGMVMMDFVTGIYSFVSFDSLADGLQESDLKFLYSNS